MILADTSVWVHHLRLGDTVVASLADELELVMHPFVLIELALGNLPQRKATLGALSELLTVTVAEHHEIAQLIESANLQGSGVGFVDVHLLASAILTPHCLVWTRDKRLGRVAERLAVAARLDN